MEDVLMELENDDEPMISGSDDEFEDIVCTEKERDEWGGIDIEDYPSHSPDTTLSEGLSSLTNDRITTQWS